MDRYEANCETGEVTVIPLTDEEVAAHDRDVAAIAAADQAQRDAAAAQRAQDIEAVFGVLPAEARDAAKRLLKL